MPRLFILPIGGLRLYNMKFPRRWGEEGQATQTILSEHSKTLSRNQSKIPLYEVVIGQLLSRMIATVSEPEYDLFLRINGESDVVPGILPANYPHSWQRRATFPSQIPGPRTRKY
ncbi:MAG: hypothetical protein CL912_21935 [Deltaproteobacteria bacterium]|nr:hypothetical protein [Deltaproteobacteria bacterium]|tara:strand:- start:5362 stop:5706 length:345 start_codon:yes stop_codon:yes gene_type:complete